TKNVKSFQPRVLDKTVIALPLLQELEAEEQARKRGRGKNPPRNIYEVIIDLHLAYPGGRAAAAAAVEVKLGLAKENTKSTIGELEHEGNSQYLFGRPDGPLIRELVRLDGQNRPRAIYRIWPDFEVSAFITKSVAT